MGFHDLKSGKTRFVVFFSDISRSTNMHSAGSILGATGTASIVPDVGTTPAVRQWIDQTNTILDLAKRNHIRGPWPAGRRLVPVRNLFRSDEDAI
jgi:hypothetical protein